MSDRSRVLRISGMVAGGLIAVAAAAVAIGAVAWRRTTARRLDLLADTMRALSDQIRSVAMG